jgi:hypothetical protein
VLAVTIRDVTAFSRFALPRIKIEHLRPVKRTLGQKRERVNPGIYLFISNYKNKGNTFCFYLPTETHPAVYFGLILFFKRLEIAHL